MHATIKASLAFVVGICFSVLLFWADMLLALPSAHQPTSSLAPSVTMAEPPLPLNDAVISVFPEASYVSLPDTPLLFGKFSLVIAETPLVFYQKEYRIAGTPLFTAYSVTLPNIISEDDAYSQAKAQIQPLAEVIEVQRYGKKSFVIRLEAHQQMMYIVIVFKNRLLGISYDIADISRFKSIDTVLKKAFPIIL